MNNEPIMIDDVNVAGCEFYWLEEHLCNNGNLTSNCQENKDCIYKRYIRKEQECEELKKYRPIIDRLLKQFETYDKLKSLDVVTFAKQTFEQLDQLKAEIKELKRKNAKKRTGLKKKQSLISELKEQLQAEIEKLNKTILQTCPNCGEAYIYHDGAKLIDKNFKLENALQEIKQLTIEAKTKQFVDMEDFWEQILQKCEVIKD